MKRQSILPQVIAAICFTAAAIAQDVEQVSLQFVSFPKAVDVEPVELLIGEGKTIPVELPTNSLSPVYKVPRLSKWMLGKAVADEEDKQIFKIYGEGKATASAKQLILVVRSGAEAADGLTLTTFDGGAKVIGNTCSPISISAKVKRQSLSIHPPGASARRRGAWCSFTTIPTVGNCAPIRSGITCCDG